MKNYLRVHLVQAEPMTRGEHLKSKNLAFIPAPGTSEDDPGYLVVYPDGYRSWCPKASFEKQGFEVRRDDRITPEDVAEFVTRGGVRFQKIGEKTTLVSRRYSTGIEDFDTSSCVDPANFNIEVGAKIASEKLDDRVWMFLGWLLAWAKNGVDRKTLILPEEVAAPAEVAKPVDPVAPDSEPAVPAMSFGDAIEAMKAGKKVTRRGWNGKGMFLWLKPSTNIKAEWCKDEMLKGLVEANGGEILGLGTICMYTHDSTGRKAILTGWLASQSDMLALDWQVVD